MNISIIGIGYVGLISGGRLALLISHHLCAAKSLWARETSISDLILRRKGGLNFFVGDYPSSDNTSLKFVL